MTADWIHWTNACAISRWWFKSITWQLESKWWIKIGHPTLRGRKMEDSDKEATRTIKAKSERRPIDKNEMHSIQWNWHLYRTKKKKTDRNLDENVTGMLRPFLLFRYYVFNEIILLSAFRVFNNWCASNETITCSYICYRPEHFSIPVRSMPTWLDVLLYFCIRGISETIHQHQCHIKTETEMSRTQKLPFQPRALFSRTIMFATWRFFYCICGHKIFSVHFYFHLSLPLSPNISFIRIKKCSVCLVGLFETCCQFMKHDETDRVRMAREIERERGMVGWRLPAQEFSVRNSNYDRHWQTSQSTASSSSSSTQLFQKWSPYVFFFCGSSTKTCALIAWESALP